MYLIFINYLSLPYTSQLIFYAITEEENGEDWKWCVITVMIENGEKPSEKYNEEDPNPRRRYK